MHFKSIYWKNDYKIIHISNIYWQNQLT